MLPPTSANGANINEDAVYTFFAGENDIHPDFGLFIVCDGIGGSGDSAACSQNSAHDLHSAQDDTVS